MLAQVSVRSGLGSLLGAWHKANHLGRDHSRHEGANESIHPSKACRQWPASSNKAQSPNISLAPNNAMEL